MKPAEFSTLPFTIYMEIDVKPYPCELYVDCKCEICQDWYTVWLAEFKKLYGYEHAQKPEDNFNNYARGRGQEAGELLLMGKWLVN